MNKVNLTFLLLFVCWQAGVQERFWMQANMVGAILAALGFAWLVKRLSMARVWRAVISVAFVSAILRVNWQDESSNTYVGDFGRTLLSGLPQVHCLRMVLTFCV
jgi:hypothetical protein